MNRSEMIEHILSRIDAGAAEIRLEWGRTGRGTRSRHCAIDRLLPDDVARAIYEAFPRDGEGFLTRKSFREHKRTSANLDQYPLILADITYALQDPRVTARISDLTGMPGLEPDPRLYAGGLSMMFEGDYLNPHIDNSHEATRSKYRRINLLYYVTPDWQAEDGGNLELWDDEVRSPVTIPSLFNRLVLMETNKESWHSVSPVVKEGPRCCVSNYYFSEASPTGDHYFHVTSFTGRPEQKIRRALGVLDNAARKYARDRLGLTRASDKGYSGALARDD